MFPDCLIYALTVLYTLTVLCGVQGLLSSETIAIEHGLGQTALSESQGQNLDLTVLYVPESGPDCLKYSLTVLHTMTVLCVP